MHYDRPEKTFSFPAAATAASRRWRRQGRKMWGLGLGALGAESQAPPRQARRWPNLHLSRDLQLAGIAKVALSN
jgi:hypothetical protein